MVLKVHEIEIDNFENTNVESGWLIFWVELGSWEDCLNLPDKLEVDGIRLNLSHAGTLKCSLC